jgi:hypothetical protein
MGMLVNVDNFARAESDRMLAGAAAEAGGVNKWAHRRSPTALDEQSVIRMNRDTLYSMALVDISEGATLTVPETGDRYVSVMAVNQDHYVNRVFHEPGEHSLGVDEFDTPTSASQSGCSSIPATRRTSPRSTPSRIGS